MPSCLIIGGGVVGLSLAYELSRRGWSVRVLDRRETGREASWAGAGILPPANEERAVHPLDRLRGLSFRLHAEWAERLRGETGIDTEYRRCGGIYLARSIGESASLHGMASLMRDEGVRVEVLDSRQLRELEPALAAAEGGQGGGWRASLWLPDEAQLRNPRHLAALRTACLRQGVAIQEHAEARTWAVARGELQGLAVGNERLTADRYCFTTGAWTAKLLEPLGISLGVLPIRGQMVLFRARPGLVRSVVNEGPRYLVPRLDGFLLAGSTEEEAGFHKETTEAGITGLIDFATSLVPALREARVEQTWAGLRPGVYDGLPYLGPIPGLANAFVAAGHFRSGLYLSPGTALVMADCIADVPPSLDLTPFRVSRG